MAIVENPQTLDLNDIQGLLTRGYSHHFETAYLMLRVVDQQKAGKWLKDTLPYIDSANHLEKKDRIIHLAFGPQGLLALGLNERNLAKFPINFREGMVAPDRSRALGDYGDNAPKKWRWGADNDEHILMVLHARTTEDMDEFIENEKARMATSGGIVLNFETRGFLPKDNKEPFGFHDGISQPVIKGCGRKGPATDIIATGEFLLGYKNEHGNYPASPKLVVEQGDPSLLRSAPDNTEYKDLGYNGSFLVFRQMQQHVERFWSAMEKHTLNPDGTVNETEKVKLAAKCVGRWPSGASLVNYPDADPGGSHVNDDFGYADKDPEGLKCPFGSHLRRNNPRDQHRDYNKEQSLKISRRHRIIRRGRNYEIKDEQGSIVENGLQFLCFNTDIELQFEFIQFVWANNNQGYNTTNDIDVIIGVYSEDNPNDKFKQFTIQDKPVNKFIDGWEPFVNIKGGSYYFFPSISVLNYLTSL